MYIYIARHAWAGNYGNAGGLNDSLRELTAEGELRYRKMIAKLVQNGFAPDSIATSPYTRCRQTAEIISELVPSHPEIEELSALEPDSNFRKLLRWTKQQNGNVCWIGHAPDTTKLTSSLLGRHPVNIRFAKGSIAAIKRFAGLDYGCGELCWHITAKSLGL